MGDVIDDIDRLRDAGAFTSREDVLEEAVRALLERQPKLRTELAVAKYADKSVSLNRAAEIAGVSPEAFKTLLESRGIDREAGFLTEKERAEKLEEF